MKFSTFKIPLYIFIFCTVVLLATACGIRKTQRGAAIGAGAGATVGALIGKTAGNTALGTIIGGAIGGTAGAYIGHKMDRVANYNRRVLFSAGSSELTDDSQTDLKKLAVDMKADPKMNVSVVGYADTLGAVNYNMDLSIKRANAVKTFLVADSIGQERLTVEGRGSAEPVATNTTAAGRARNRRVEIVVMSISKK